VADPDLELKGRVGVGGFFACPADFSSFCLFFYPK